MTTPQPIPETVEALLDTTWRVTASEAARTDALDRKAATVATFASLVAALTATLGSRFARDVAGWWAFALFVCGLVVLVGSVAYAVRTLWPLEHLTLGISYIRRFPTWGETRKSPEQVRGETMRTLVEAIARERAVNDSKLRWLRWNFVLLLAGLVLVAIEAATLSLHEISR